MYFLLVNDDGIESEGLHALVDALSEVGTVYVCAPDVQQSGMSHSISLVGSITVKEWQVRNAVKAWRVTGTPADCTKMGLQMCEKEGIKPDIVFSGVNKGSNLGVDTLYSGTVGAAMEAALQGIHGVAVSVNSHGATHFEGACKLAVQAIDYVMTLPENIVVNINAPNVPIEEIKGIRYSRLGPNYYVDGFVLQENGEYVLEGYIPDYSYLPEEVDVGANYAKYATVTPLKFDITAYEYLDTVKDWNLKI